MPVLKFRSLITFLCLLFAAVNSYADGEGPVWITKDIKSLEVNHEDRTVVIERIQNNEHMIDWDYALTSRPCPPFCVQPMNLASGVETIGELEVLDYLKAMQKGDEKIMLIDSRDEWWLGKGMIPGAVSIPWKKLHAAQAEPQEIAKILEFDFGAIFHDGLWNFENAKTLVFYCNGVWCGQSPTNILSLLAVGYPPGKLKWYRGGMQAWKGLGLTTIPKKAE